MWQLVRSGRDQTWTRLPIEYFFNIFLLFNLSHKNRSSTWETNLIKRYASVKCLSHTAYKPMVNSKPYIRHSPTRWAMLPKNPLIHCCSNSKHASLMIRLAAISTCVINHHPNGIRHLQSNQKPFQNTHSGNNNKKRTRMWLWVTISFYRIFFFLFELSLS